MKPITPPWHLLAMIFSTVALPIATYAAPGEDPITLEASVEFLAMPTPAPAPSGGLDGSTLLPASARAQMSRYQAKAFSATADDGTIFTDKDVVTTVHNDGFKTTCVQEVGSVTGEEALGTRYGPNKREQIVVLRGSLVNVCK